MRAYPPQGLLLFETILNFGIVELGDSHEETATFQNRGSIAADVTLACKDGMKLQIDPPSFQILPNEKVKARVTYTPTEAGIYRGEIKVVTAACSYS